MLASKTRIKRLAVEGLEDRALLAGDVTVAVVNGNLMIDGDNDDNSISIAAGATAGAVLVTGLETAGVDTSINGAVSAGGVEFANVTGKIIIRTRGGDDSVAIDSMTAQDLRIQTGSGDDDVSLAAGLTVEGDLRIQTDGGEDSVIAVGTTINGKVKIETGNDADNVSLTDLLVGQSDDDGDGNGNGNGGATAANNEGNGRFGILGRLFDRLFDGGNYCGGGHDETGTVEVDLGNGDDLLSVDGMTAAKFNVYGGNGNDTATVAGVVAAKLDVDLGRGNDSLAASASTVDHFMAKLGDGDDDVSIAADVAISTSLKLDGGRGTDDLTSALPGNVPLNLVRRGFETIGSLV